MRHVCVHCQCLVSCNAYLMIYRMAGRNDCTIFDAIESVSQALHGQ